MKKLLVLLVLVSTLLVLAGCGGTAQQPAQQGTGGQTQEPPKQETVRLTWAADTVGGSYHTLSSAIAKVINEKSAGKYEVTVQAVGGAMDMSRRVIDKKADIGLGATALLLQAWRGETPTYKGNVWATVEEVQNNVRAYFTYHYGAWQFIVKDNSSIKSIEDLKGKKVATGEQSGSTVAMYGETLLKAYGLEAGKDYEPFYLSNQARIDSLKDDIVDCTVISGQYPTGIVEDLASITPIRLLPSDEEHIKQASQMLGGATVVKVLQPGGYSKMTNKEPITAMAINSTTLVRADLPEETVYDITKLMWENIEDIYTTAPVFKTTVTKEELFTGTSSPYHSGAVKYFREIGLQVPDNLIPPEMKK